MRRTAQVWTLVAALVAAAFALRTLLLIDATALWSDELYSVGKSFQPSPLALLEMLRQDTHPPLYYGLLWSWGQLVGQTPVSLRLLSWLAYLAGGGVMVAQAVALADGRRSVLPLALLLAFCSPYPVRFAIEGKSYALLVLLVALAWWWRRAERSVPYGVMAGLAGLTHFYGLFLVDRPTGLCPAGGVPGPGPGALAPAQAAVGRGARLGVAALGWDAAAPVAAEPFAGSQCAVALRRDGDGRGAGLICEAAGLQPLLRGAAAVGAAAAVGGAHRVTAPSLGPKVGPWGVGAAADQLVGAGIR